VAASQRDRLLDACAELMAEGGWAAVTIGDLARRAGVSRGAFYALFADKEDCLLAAYGRFAEGLAIAMTSALAADTPWPEFVDRLLDGYLGTLERDPDAARAFVVEMDGAGASARASRREAAHGFATLLATRHATLREHDRTLGALSDRAFLGLVLGVRELVRETLETDPDPHPTALAPDVRTWISATLAGA
jgi:AcrR family transcriptional regulator